jgi:hypothetical protein
MQGDFRSNIQFVHCATRVTARMPEIAGSGWSEFYPKSGATKEIAYVMR